MAVSHRCAVLTAHGVSPALLARALHSWCLAVCLCLPGCGLLFDALQLVYPVTVDELDAICRRGQVQVGMAAEPFRPFVFPAVWTDEGARITGLDAELIRAISDALSDQCGTPVSPVLHLVRFRDLFLLLNEGQLDFFVSAVAAGTPSPARSGFAYSTPYFSHGGVGGISKRLEILETVRAKLPADDRAFAPAHALTGLTVAVQDGTAAHAYADAVLKPDRLILCDSFPAAFEYLDAGGMPIDVILGAQPVLQFMVNTTRKDWHLLMREADEPLLFTDADYAVVMAEESYRLRWFMNDVIYRLRRSGRLEAMRHRWMEESYAYPRRASMEGLPFDVNKMPAHYAQGSCRETSRPQR